MFQTSFARSTFQDACWFSAHQCRGSRGECNWNVGTIRSDTNTGKASTYAWMSWAELEVTLVCKSFVAFRICGIDRSTRGKSSSFCVSVTSFCACCINCVRSILIINFFYSLSIFWEIENNFLVCCFTPDQIGHLGNFISELGKYLNFRPLKLFNVLKVDRIFQLRALSRSNLITQERL